VRLDCDRHDRLPESAAPALTGNRPWPHHCPAELVQQGAFDDQVDALAQSLTRLGKPGPQIRVLSW